MSLEAFYTLTRFAHFIAAMLMCGMSMFAVIVSHGQFRVLLQDALKKSIIFSAVITIITTFCWMIAQSGLMGDGWEDALNMDIWQGVLGTTFGQIWRWEILSAVGLFAVLFIRPITLKLYLILGFSFIILGLHAFIGHAAMHEGWLGIAHQTNQFIHLISCAYWFGGLWPFLICIQFLRSKEQLKAGLETQIVVSMKRYSQLGHIAVICVLITGIINSLILLPGWPFTSTLSEYQSWLWLKIALVGLMVLLALTNRYWVVPRLQQQGQINYLIINSWAELLLGTIAILAVAIFATYQPV
ncbi:TPA: copper homeostasis membrane protein CopD [Providencia alcalifaciens]